MLNFREELNKIKEEKLTASEAVTHQVDFCMEAILEYFKKKEVVEFFKEVELKFIAVGNRIVVIENPNGGHNQLFDFVFGDSNSVSQTMLNIEQKLLSEGFKLTSKERAVREGKFCIKINV